jgi:FtsZ-binding cell division protein ZapB
MEDKSILSLRNRIAQLEIYIKRNLEPTIMSLYMDIDRLNKKVKSLSSNEGGNDETANLTAETQQTSANNIQTSPNALENAIQTMEMLKQRNRRIGPVQNIRQMNPQAMQQRPQLPVGQSGRVIDN